MTAHFQAGIEILADHPTPRRAAPAVPPGDGRPHPATAQHALWRHIFGDETGLMVAFSGERRPGEQKLRDEKTRYFAWPDQAHRASQWLQAESNHGRCAYVCAHLVTKRRRVKENAANLLAAYVDADGATVPSTLPRPTAVVESSPGRDQLYWRLTRAVEPTFGEQLNKRLAKAMGADMSGWDLTQLLRAPGTRNYKYRERVEVAARSIEDRAYDPDELDRILPPLPEATTPKPEPRPAGRVTGDAATVLERMLNGKRGAELGDWYHGGGRSTNQSSIDLSFHNATAFYSDRDPVVMDQLHRASALMRDKWDEVHYADGRTYGQATIDKAIADCHTSIGDLVAKPAPPAEPVPAPDGTTAPDEVAELRAALAAANAEIARRGGAIDNLADVVHVQQVRLQAVIGELEEKTAFLSHVTEVLAKPNEEMDCTGKVLALVLASETHFRADRGRAKLPLVVLCERTGLSKNTVSKRSRELAEREGSPFERTVTREQKMGDDGVPQWISTVEFRPRTERTADTLRAIAQLPPDPSKVKRGGSKAAAEARWQCREHPTSDVIVTSTARCATCEEEVGEPKITAMKADRPLNHTSGDSDNTSPAVDVYVPKGHTFGDSDGLDELTLARRAQAAQAIPIGADVSQYKTVEFADRPPTGNGENLGPIAVTRTNGHAPPDGAAHGVMPSARGSSAPAPSKPPPWRCPECRASERKVRPDGSSRCPRGHVSHESAEVAG